jgi:arginyl-tRNA synthetase
MKEKIASLLQQAIGVVAGGVGTTSAAVPELSVPDEAKFGHYSTNVAMRLAKARGVAPLDLACELAAKVERDAPAGFFDRVEAAAPGFINFWLSKEAVQEEFAKVARDGDFGRNNVGEGRKVIIDYSSVNIAKPFHLGHLRTTIIGEAIANILDANGYAIIRWNYLGDWGTQFGKMIAAYKRWGKKEDIERQPVEELQKLYVRFHEEATVDPRLEKEGQEEFRKLEEGDKENRKLWEWFKKESLIEFENIYKELGVEFDLWIGESFFEKEMKPLVAELLEKGVAERSEGAVVIRLDEYNLQPALIEKSDGASLYLTRDIANLRYRIKKYAPMKILYVVANEQAFQFEQLFAVAKKIGIEDVELKHLKYGLVLGEAGKKFSTRRGEAIAVSEVFSEAIALSRAVVEEKAHDLSAGEKDAVARAVGIGALKYNDLKENRMTDIIFDWDTMLDFTGDSGPYLQYAYARLRSILRKASDTPRVGTLDSDVERALMRKIFEFPDVIEKAGELYATSILAAYLYKLAVAANKFYETTPILKDDNARRRVARLALVEVAARTIKAGLALLGIEAPEKI